VDIVFEREPFLSEMFLGLDILIDRTGDMCGRIGETESG
jgi:hypothetical protein